jgi:hypothetical protein
MAGLSVRDAYEFDPETYGGEGGGIADIIRRHLQSGSQQPGTEFASAPSGTPDFSPETSFSAQGGLLGRLLSLRAEQSQYQPTSDDNDRATFVSTDPNFRQLARIPNSLQPMPLPAPQPQASASHMQAQDEADQAQLARDAAAARLVRGVRSVRRAEAPEPDPIDIAKSAGIGLVNGGVNLVGLPADVVAALGSDYLKSWRSGELRQWMGGADGFYQPKSRVGRFAETIGEMVPALLAGEGLGVAVNALRGGQAAAALRELPATLMKHAVAPGIAVQVLQEALPDSKAGQTLQKAYPVVRRGLPIALAATRYLGRRSVPQ